MAKIKKFNFMTQSTTIVERVRDYVETLGEGRTFSTESAGLWGTFVKVSCTDEEADEVDRIIEKTIKEEVAAGLR